MKTLEKEEDKIQQICDALRKETLEPAQKEAEYIVTSAKGHANEIIREAQKQAERFIAEAQRTIEQERNVFQSSLSQAAKQSLEALRQAIEQQLFNPELHQLIVQHTADPAIIAKFIQALIKAIEKEGLEGNLNAVAPHSVNPQQVNALIGEAILKRLKGNSVTLDGFAGGVKVRLESKKITLDISDTEIESLLKQYIRKDFRKMLFAPVKE